MDHASARLTPLPPADRREPGELFGNGFTLFADMLLVGLVTALSCLPVVTAPAAFAAASATLRDGASGTAPVTAAGYLRRLRARLTGGSLAAGLLPPLLVVVVLLDAALVRGALPGAALVAPALALTVLAAAVVALRATALDAPHQLSGRVSLARSLGDPRGSALLAAAVVLAALLAWAVPLLVPLLPGPLALAATAVEIRSAGVTKPA
ncbi:hypothetical protein [Streptomyces sp. NPDC101181]|uniref:hypothetical protein n=1 Tax=Streptomyces sp. NPDC101181 TaxID=3366125 RepID=UPI0037F88405